MRGRTRLSEDRPSRFLLFSPLLCFDIILIRAHSPLTRSSLLVSIKISPLTHPPLARTAPGRRFSHRFCMVNIIYAAYHKKLVPWVRFPPTQTQHRAVVIFPSFLLCLARSDRSHRERYVRVQLTIHSPQDFACAQHNT